MSERAGLRIDTFTQSIATAYPPFVSYSIHPEHPQVEAITNPAFRRSREVMATAILSGEAFFKEMAEALVLEHIVNLSLRNPLEDVGFKVDLTPQSLEKSNQGQKGVDLLVCDTEQMVYLGIDVKLRRGKSPYERDGFGWNSNLLSPFIYLSLGNFKVDMWDKDNVGIREWLGKYVIPKVITTGKIPEIDVFRKYLLTRIEKSLTGCVERIREPDLFKHDFGLPKTPREQLILEEKLALMESLFQGLLLQA